MAKLLPSGIIGNYRAVLNYATSRRLFHLEDDVWCFPVLTIFSLVITLHNLGWNYILLFANDAFLKLVLSGCWFTIHSDRPTCCTSYHPATRWTPSLQLDRPQTIRRHGNTAGVRLTTNSRWPGNSCAINKQWNESGDWGYDERKWLPVTCLQTTMETYRRRARMENNFNV